MAVICEEFESHQDGSVEPEILMGQSIILGDIKAELPLQNEDSMNDQILWQQYIQQIESLSPESLVSRYCKEARFMRVVEVGQYFLTKDTGSFSVDIDALFLAALWLSHWARGCGLVEQPTASSRFGSTGVLWVLTGTHRCDTPIQAG